MLAVQQFCNYITRGSLAPLIQYIVSDLAMSTAQKALLLGAFFPVFTPFQIVAGPLCQWFGAKQLLTMNLGGMATLLMLLPSCAKASGAWAMCACLAGIGVCQGVLVPSQGQLKRNWLTDGPERVWALRVIGLGMRVGYPAAASFTPWLAQRFGWRAVPYVFGVPMAAFGVLWHFFAAETPKDVASATTTPLQHSQPTALDNDDEGRPALVESPKNKPELSLKLDLQVVDEGDTNEAQQQLDDTKAMEWGIFRVPAVLAAVATHVASNNMGYTFLIWTPTYYNEVLKLSNMAAGAYISFPGTVGIWGPFIVRAIVPILYNSVS